MVTVKTVKDEKTVAKAQYTRAENELKKVIDKNDVEVATIQRRFNELAQRWQTVQDRHDNYMTQIPLIMKAMREKLGLQSWRKDSEKWRLGLTKACH